MRRALYLFMILNFSTPLQSESTFAAELNQNCINQLFRTLFPTVEQKVDRQHLKFNQIVSNSELDISLKSEMNLTLDFLKEQKIYRKSYFNFALALKTPEQHILYRKILSLAGKEAAAGYSKIIFNAEIPSVASELTDFIKKEGLDLSKIENKIAEIELRPFLTDKNVKELIEWGGVNAKMSTILNRYSNFSRSTPDYSTIKALQESGFHFQKNYGGHMNLKTDIYPGKVRFRLGSIKSKVGAKYGTSTEEMEASKAMVFFMRDLLWASAVSSVKHPDTYRIEFIAQNVVSKDLQKLFPEMGFKLEKNPRKDLYIENYNVTGNFYRLSLVKKDIQIDQIGEKVLKTIKFYDYQPTTSAMEKIKMIDNPYQALALEFICSKRFEISKRVDEIMNVKSQDQLIEFEEKLN